MCFFQKYLALIRPGSNSVSFSSFNLVSVIETPKRSEDRFNHLGESEVSMSRLGGFNFNSAFDETLCGHDGGGAAVARNCCCE